MAGARKLEAGERILQILGDYEEERATALQTQDALRTTYLECLRDHKSNLRKVLINSLQNIYEEDLEILSRLLVGIQDEWDILCRINTVMQAALRKHRDRDRGSEVIDGEHDFEPEPIMDSNYAEQAVSDAYTQLVTRAGILKSDLDNELYPDGCPLKMHIELLEDIPTYPDEKVKYLELFYTNIREIAKVHPTPDLEKFAYIIGIILLGAGIFIGVGPVISYEAAGAVDALITLVPAAVSRIKTGSWQFWKNPIEKLEAIANDQVQIAHNAKLRP